MNEFFNGPRMPSDQRLFAYALITLIHFRGKFTINWDKVFKNRPSKVCGKQPLKNFSWSILEYFVPIIASAYA